VKLGSIVRAAAPEAALFMKFLLENPFESRELRFFVFISRYEYQKVNNQHQFTS
jgi:hypothetical protein